MGDGLGWVLCPKEATYSSPGLAYPPTLGKEGKKSYPEGVASEFGCDVEDRTCEQPTQPRWGRKIHMP
jgi:hypothetical protein